MVISSDDFFREKRPWSSQKDGILRNYLAPYFAKVNLRRRPVKYADFFSGPGEYDCGSIGSPLIALEAAESHLDGWSSRSKAEYLFSDCKYAQQLERVVSARYPDSQNIEVYAKVYADAIVGFLGKVDRHDAVFAYIDPFGIKDLDLRIFEGLSQASSSVELLINLNSVGFLREACRLLKVAPRISDELLDEYPREHSGDTDIRGAARWDDVAGGQYWRDLVREYQSDPSITFWTLERRFINEYVERLREFFAFVVNAPVKENYDAPHLKYRMIHATQHRDGVLLMSEEMFKSVDDKRSTTLWVLDVENQGDLERAIEDAVHCVASELDNSEWTDADDVVARVICELGTVCKPSAIRNILTLLESEGVIEREERTTPTGKPARGWCSKKGKRVRIRRVLAESDATTEAGVEPIE